jgi:ankyrin repeat domain-containing protein 50
LQLDVLLESKSIAGIKKALNTLPTTLDEFYDYTLRVIDEQHETKAYAAFQWLAFSARPLLLSELAESIIIQPRGEPYIDPDERFMDEDQVLDLLPAGLVRKVFKSVQRIGDEWHTLPFVEFAHFSVLEYLKSSRMCSELRPKYQIEEIKTHTMIGEACLAYLLYIGETEQTFAKDMEDILGCDGEATYALTPTSEGSWRRSSQFRRERLNTDYTLADYANRAWHYHLCLLQSVTSAFLDRLVLKFLNYNANSWTIWCYYKFADAVFHHEHILLNPNLPAVTPRLAEKIHPVTWISWLGLSRHLRLLLKEPGDLSQLQATPHFGKPLHAAAARGNTVIVQILLLSQADVNERGGSYGTPLIAASHSGSVEVVKMLLESGADPNVQAKGRTALMEASRSGSVEAVKLLLESGADINAKAGGRNALWPAVIMGDSNITSLLLDAGADIGSREERGGAYQQAVKICEGCSEEFASDYQKIIDLLDAHLGRQQQSNMQDQLAEPECTLPHIYVVEKRDEEYGVYSY